MATRINVTLEYLRHLLARVDRQQLEADDWPVVDALVSKLIARTEARQARLKAKANQQATEQQAAQTEGDCVDDADATEESSDLPPGEGAAGEPPPTDTGVKDPPKGHGRNGAGAFVDATQHFHPLADGILGGICPACAKGPVSPYRDKVTICVVGQPTFRAEANHFAQGRCKRCGAIFTAEGTEMLMRSGIGTGYIIYAWSACAMLIVQHYFATSPFKRIEALHQGWGVPMPDSNQWRIADECDDLLMPLHKALERHGIRNATTLRFDDTGSVIIETRRQIQKEIAVLESLGEPTTHVRTGINASCIYLETGQGKVVLFFTGRHHAGEIVDRILEHRRACARKLVAVSDAASKNFSLEHADKLEQAVCNAHCYLKFRAIRDQFPAEHAVAGEVYDRVFDNDDKAKALGLDPDDRMLHHRKHSKPQMLRLFQMCKDKIDGNLVEPNSPLWEPVSFVVNQWPRLTKFYEVPGVPLDTNVVEQTLIIPVRYLASSFSYKTQNGADVGDRHMSLVATANANGVEPVAYLTECLQNHEDLAIRPEYYLPWTWRDRIAQRDRVAETRAPAPSSTSPPVEHPLRPGTRRPGPVDQPHPTFFQRSGNEQLDGSPPQMRI
jgi:hypothetical protein